MLQGESQIRQYGRIWFVLGLYKRVLSFAKFRILRTSFVNQLYLYFQELFLCTRNISSFAGSSVEKKYPFNIKTF